MEESLNRKMKSIEYLKERNIEFDKDLPGIPPASEITLRGSEAIATRAVCCLVTIQHAFDILNNSYVDRSRKFFSDLLNSWSLTTLLTDDEKKIFSGKANGNDLNKMVWKYEECWVLMWALGLVDKLEMPNKCCDAKKLINLVSTHKSFNSFYKTINMRDVSEILDETDLNLRYFWIINKCALEKKEIPQNIEPGIVIERHHAFGWIINMQEDWL